MSKETKCMVTEIIYDMQHSPEIFKCGPHTLKDSKRDMEYWICNGASHAGVYHPYTIHFGFIQGWRFISALRKWQAWDVLNKGKAKESE